MPTSFARDEGNKIVRLPDGNGIRLDEMDHRLYFVDSSGNTIAALTADHLGDPHTKIEDIYSDGKTVFVLAYDIEDPETLFLRDLQGNELRKFKDMPAAKFSPDGGKILAKKNIGGMWIAFSVGDFQGYSSADIDKVQIQKPLSGRCGYLRLDRPGPWGEPAPGVDPKNRAGSMEMVPLQVQDSHTCYANAAARMVDAYRFSHDPPKGDRDYGHISSPIMAALGTRSEDPAAIRIARKKLEGNSLDGDVDICSVVNYMRRKGSCDRRDAEDEHGSSGDSLISDFFQRDVVEPFLADYSLRTEENSCLANLSGVAFSALGMDLETLLDQILLKEWCPRRIKIDPNLQCEHLVKQNFSGPPTGIVRADKDTVQAALDRLLGGKAPVQPADILFCESALSGNAKPCDIFHSHHALVIGRRWTSSGTCEYLIQSSFECSGHAHDCDQGKTWIDIKDFENNVFDIAHIK